jgi:oligogalacturonide transporter
MVERPIRFINYLAYGAGDVMGAGATAVMSIWSVYFYTTFCGLTPIEATGIFGIARILDAIWSPLVGYLSDNLANTRIGRKFGRRRFFLLIALPLLPCFAAMWVSGQSYLYYLSTFVFFELLYASVLIPYETLAAEMTPDYEKKATFAGARILTGQTSAIVAGILPAVIASVMSQGVGSRDPSRTFYFLGMQWASVLTAETFTIMGAIYAGLLVAAILFTYLFTWERSPSEIAKQPQAPRSIVGVFAKLYTDLLSTLRIRAFRLHLGIYLGGYISQDIYNVAFTYFIVFALAGTGGAASSLTAMMFFAQLISVACFIPLIVRIHPGGAYRVASSVYAIAIITMLVLAFVLPGKALAWMLIPVLIAGLGRGGLNYIPWNTYNYMADVDEIVTGRRREGVFAGVMTFIRKTAQAGAVALAGILLEAGGFLSGSTQQSSEAVTTIIWLLAAGPLVVLALGFLVSLRFRLSAATHAVLMSEIARFKAGETAPASAETKAVVEDLTGWPYEKLWGMNSVGYRPRDAT